MSARQPDDPRFSPIILRRDLIAEGWNDRAISRMLDCGQWVKPRHGAYVDAAAWRACDDAGRHELMTRAVLRQARTPVVPSHVSGVPFHEGPTWGLDLSSSHVTRRDGKAGRAEAGVVQHRGQILAGDVVERHGVEVMAAHRLALELTTVASTEASLVAMNHLLHAKHTTPQQIRERYELGIERWPSTLRTDSVIRLADPRPESVGESRFVYLCYCQHLPAPVPQYKVYDGRGNLVAILDFAWPEYRAFVEFDGKVKYQKLLKPGESPTDVVLREKRREELVCGLTEWKCLRVIWADLGRPEHTGSLVHRLLAHQPVFV